MTPIVWEWRQRDFSSWTSQQTKTNATRVRRVWEGLGWECTNLWDGGHDIRLVARRRLVDMTATYADPRETVDPPGTLLDIPWSPEPNESGYERVTGYACGYRVSIEAGPSGRWRAELLNQCMIGKSENLTQAKSAALAAAASWLLLEALSHTPTDVEWSQ